MVGALGETPLPAGTITGRDGSLPPTVGLLLVALIGLVAVTRRGWFRAGDKH